jgi:fatty acid desaturase
MISEDKRAEIEAKRTTDPVWQWFNRTSQTYWKFAGRLAGYFPQALGRVQSTNPFFAIARLTLVFAAGFLIVPPLYLVIGPFVQLVLVIIAVIWTCVAGIFGWNRPSTSQLAERIAQEGTDMTGKHLISIPRHYCPNVSSVKSIGYRHRPLLLRSR